MPQKRMYLKQRIQPVLYAMFAPLFRASCGGVFETQVRGPGSRIQDRSPLIGMRCRRPPPLRGRLCLILEARPAGDGIRLWIVTLKGKRVWTVSQPCPREILASKKSSLKNLSRTTHAARCAAQDGGAGFAVAAGRETPCTSSCFCLSRLLAACRRANSSVWRERGEPGHNRCQWVSACVQ